MNIKLNVKPFDFAAAGLAVGITVGCAFFIYAGGGNQSSISIHVKAEKTEWIFPQDATEIINVHGPLGNTVIEARDRRVRVIASPCDNQTCVAVGTIQKRGQWIACLPNKVLISIEESKGSQDSDEVDAALW
ncbi:MAG: NusG domain II-containing protein [Spirochaetaceae bacterium]|nr:NusG domain II-containing protein [Spirochaetaceae bacterium]